MSNTAPPRIVSLIASSTEIVHALGMGQFMVGRSHECDYPSSIKNLPVCTGPKFQTDGSSYEIDQRVKAIVQESLSVYKVYAEVLEELKPSHIITQAQCEVCAVSLKDVEEAACHLISSQPQIVSLQPDCLEDIWSDIRKVGESLNISKKAEPLIETLKQRVFEINGLAEMLSLKEKTPTVAVVEWIEPLMAAGNWMPELVQMAGGENLFGEAGKHSPWMKWDDIIEKDPDVIIVTPCGFDNERTLKEMHLISGQPGYNNLKAVKNGRVYVADGNQYFNRPGPRVVESLEMMAEMIHPQTFDFNHEGTGWIKYKVG
jgi:iron complex transport system substrate-binding protein